MIAGFFIGFHFSQIDE